jgi:hypothetical protein
MSIVIERVDKEDSNVSDTLRTVIIGSFAVLGSLQLRELVTDGITMVVPTVSHAKLLLTGFMTALIFLIVIVLAIVW